MVVYCLPQISTAEAYENTSASALELADEEYTEVYEIAGDFEYGDNEILGSSVGIEIPSNFDTGIGRATIHLQGERLEISALRFSQPTFYSINGGRTWRTWNLPTTTVDPLLYRVDISSLLNKKLDLRLSWEATSREAKESSQRLSFPVINARRRGNFDKLRIIYRNDNTWTLLSNELSSYEWTESPIADNSEWRPFPASGRNVQARGLPRESIWLRKRATQIGTSPSVTYHPTSRPFQMRPRNASGPPKMRFRIRHSTRNGSRPNCEIFININRNLAYSIWNHELSDAQVLTERRTYTQEMLERACLEQDADFDFDEMLDDPLNAANGWGVPALRIQRPIPISGNRPASGIQVFTFGRLREIFDGFENVCLGRNRGDGCF
jgi:hypothetical protein